MKKQKHLILLVVLCVIKINIYAQKSIVIDGLNYQIESNQKATITGYTSTVPPNVIIHDRIIYRNAYYVVTSIDDGAFANCKSMVSIAIPSSITNIQEEAFSNCSSLKSVEIPSSVDAICKSTFYGCSSLTSIKIPSSVIYICDQSFYGCSSLTSVEFPSSVFLIQYRAFYGCSKLATIVFSSPEIVLDHSSFEGCSSLTNIIFLTEETPIIEAVFPTNSSIYVPNKGYMKGRILNGSDLKLINELKNSEFVYSGEVPSLEFAYSDMFKFDFSIDSLKTEVGSHSLKTVVASEFMTDTLVLYTDYKIIANPMSVKSHINDEDNNDPRIYDLLGRRVNNTQGLKGLFIVNGRKTFLR